MVKNGSSRLNNVFLKIFPYDSTSKFQELETGSDQIFTRKKRKICLTKFSQTKKMWNFVCYWRQPLSRALNKRWWNAPRPEVERVTKDAKQLPILKSETQKQNYRMLATQTLRQKTMQL